jgi:hypothetical protein
VNNEVGRPDVFFFRIKLPNGTEGTLTVPLCELKRILVSLGERDSLTKRMVEILLLCSGLEEA